MLMKAPRSRQEHAPLFSLPQAPWACALVIALLLLVPTGHADTREGRLRHGYVPTHLVAGRHLATARRRAQRTESRSVRARRERGSRRLEQASTRRPAERSRRTVSMRARRRDARESAEARSRRSRRGRESRTFVARDRRLGVEPRSRATRVARLERPEASVMRPDRREEEEHPTPAVSPEGAYASGESHPPDDERQPMEAGSSEASISAGPNSHEINPEAPAEPSRDADESVSLSKLQQRPSAREMAEAAIEPRVLPIYTRSGRLIMPPPLRGSREILVHQNEMADAAGLERIRDDGELDRLRATHRLVNLASSASLHVNPELPENRRCARPWTARFAVDIAQAYYRQFGEPLELNSAVRTISYQLRLQRVNGNAASVEGETASPHLTGQAIDFGKRGMSLAEIAWMRAYLGPLMQSGAIDVEEEFQQACFHISVYRSYLAMRTMSHREDVAQAQGVPRGYHHAEPVVTSSDPQD